MVNLCLDHLSDRICDDRTAVECILLMGPCRPRGEVARFVLAEERAGGEQILILLTKFAFLAIDQCQHGVLNRAVCGLG